MLARAGSGMKFAAAVAMQVGEWTGPRKAASEFAVES